MIVVMGGSTGAGKTTHGKLLAMNMGWAYVSSGDIARSLMDAQTDALFKEGQLSPHEAKIRNALYAAIWASDVCVLDGFPRMMEQYEVLNEWSRILNRDLVLVWLRPSRAVLVHRWGLRHRDAYDNELAAKKRDELYAQSTVPLLERFQIEHTSLRVDVGELDEPIEFVQNVIVSYFQNMGKEATNGRTTEVS